MQGLLTRRVFVRSLLGTTTLPWIACRAESPNGDAGHAGLDADEKALCEPFLTPVDAFFQQAGGRATVDGWSMPNPPADAPLEIAGLVERPTTLSLAALEAERNAHLRVLNTMMCILGLRSTAIWTGIPVRTLLTRAGIDRERARRVRFVGADGFVNNLTVSDIFESPDDLFEPLLAFRIGDQPLPRQLGYPMRLLLNDRYGYKNVKWLAHIEVTNSDEPVGHYQQRGYSDIGVIEPVPVVEGHRVAETVPRGPIELCGFALSGLAGIKRVDVHVDGGPPAAATLVSVAEASTAHPALNGTLQQRDPRRFGVHPRGVWVRFRFSFSLAAGDHEVEITTHDADGNQGRATTLRLTAV